MVKIHHEIDYAGSESDYCDQRDREIVELLISVICLEICVISCHNFPVATLGDSR